jgi:hypothetical protein
VTALIERERVLYWVLLERGRQREDVHGLIVGSSCRDVKPCSKARATPIALLDISLGSKKMNPRVK